MQSLDDKINRLLAIPPYSQPPEGKQASLLELLKEEIERACQRHSGYENYVRGWPSDYHSADQVASLPYLPVSIFKANPPLSLVARNEITRTVNSSATTSQSPSRVALDLPTSRRMTKGIATIVRDFIGPARRPYLVVDVLGNTGAQSELGAREAAIRGLQPFASKVNYCLDLNDLDSLVLNQDKLRGFVREWQNTESLVYGFTYILWNHLVKPLLADGVCLNLPKVRILHSGGWKRLQEQSVEKTAFNKGVACVFGCSPDCVIDFYGMVESIGVIFPDCAEGNKHSPAFGEVIVRDILTLQPVRQGEHGVVQVCSVLPTSFPGHLLLTEDMARVIAYDGCPCGRRGISFRFAGRIPKAEIRGCGNLESKRSLTD
jgi:hypothetical protein